MKMDKHKISGFTLLEMMLVLAIMASIMVMLINLGEQRFDQFKRDKAALQMQQILNAALSYYTSNGSWPVGTGATLGNCATAGVATLSSAQVLQSSGFLPSAITINNPWASPYQVSCTTTNGLNNFIVTTDTLTTTNASILAGELPIAGVTTGTAGNMTAVTAQVPVPGQNLNNARSINFSGIYHSGGCVPVPTCPNGMTATILVFPASVTGATDEPTGCTATNPPTCTAATVYPIESYTAYATATGVASAGGGPPPCSTPTSGSALCYSSLAPGGGAGGWTQLTSGNYWRVCLQVQTTNGQASVQSATGNPGASSTSDDIYWAGLIGTVIATTRCAPTNEPVGSSVNVWGN